MNETELKLRKAEVIERLKDWCRRAHQIELTIGENTHLNDSSTAAYVESQHARMFAGDLLRLALLEADARSPTYFNPQNHNAHVQEAFDWGEMVEVALIAKLKEEVRQLFYEVIDANISVLFGFNLTEFMFYKLQLQVSLKRTDQRLGLLLGIISKSKLRFNHFQK